MKYHVESEYDDLMEIRCDREELFEAFINNIEQGKKVTKEEIVIILGQLQEYLNSDFPYERNPEQSNIVNAFELVCRVAISLAERPYDIDTSYISKKLFSALKFLRLEK